MSFFLRYGQINKNVLNPVRHLKNFVIPRQEFVFGNFTAIFAVLASLEHHGRDMHPMLTFICPDFWLDHVSKKYLQENWGQTREGLPKCARDMFDAMFPHYDEKSFLTWQQVQELRQTGLYALKKQYNIPVYHGEPFVEREKNGFRIEIKHPQKQLTLLGKSDAHFYIWYKKPKKIILNGVMQPASTEIYHSSEELPPNKDIIVLGSGLSVVWLAKHFANDTSSRKIICLKHPGAELLKVPANSTVDYSRIVMLDVDKVKIEYIEDDPHSLIIHSLETKQTYKGLFFSATGVETPMENFKGIPGIQTTSPDQWIASRWIAPKNIPIGSLMESIARWFAITDNLSWGFEPQSYHEATDFFKKVIHDHFSPALKLDLQYLDALGHTIMSLSNPIKEKELRPFLTDVYRKVYQPESKQIELFEKDVTRLLEQQLKIALEDQSKPEFTL